MDFDTMLSFSKQFALVWFFLIFVAILLWAYWPSRKKRFEDDGKRLLDNDPIHERTTKNE